MANVEHSVLTGTDLHEPKGISAAVANRVYLSNGAGSGSWTTVPDAAIAAAVKPFQSQLYHIRDERSSGTNSSSMTNAIWNQRALNTEVTDELTVTLSGNQFSLVAGTYWLDGFVIAFHVIDMGGGGSASAKSKIRLQNMTDSTTTLISGSVYSEGDGTGTYSTNLIVPISGRFTLGGTKLMELQHWASFGSGTSVVTGGQAVGSGVNEVYADLKIWKLS